MRAGPLKEQFMCACVINQGTKHYIHLVFSSFNNLLGPNPSEKAKVTRVRRLYDIANILQVRVELHQRS